MGSAPCSFKEAVPELFTLFVVIVYMGCSNPWVAAEVLGEVVDGGVVGVSWEGFNNIVRGDSCRETWCRVLLKDPGDYIFQFAFRAGPFVCFYSIVDGFSHFSLVFCVTKFFTFGYRSVDEFGDWCVGMRRESRYFWEIWE